MKYALESNDARGGLGPLSEWIETGKAPVPAHYAHGVLMGITMFASPKDMERLTE